MNKWMQKFALYLIDRRLLKLKLGEQPKGFWDDEFGRLRALRLNISGINGFWQGNFAAMPWKYFPKNKKHIKHLDPLLLIDDSEYELSEEDARWADMSREEFYAELDNEQID